MVEFVWNSASVSACHLCTFLCQVASYENDWSLTRMRSLPGLFLCAAFLCCPSAFAANTQDAAAAPLPPPSVDEAWGQLKAAAEAKDVNTRIDAMTALSVLPHNKDAAVLLRKAFNDAEVDVRMAAIIAAGETKNRDFTNDLRSLLDDPTPQVAFTSAMTLWKMGDRSGQDILLAVVNGDRKTDKGFLKEGMHHANRTLHDPAKLMKEGAIQTASIFLPPVGYGMGAYRYMHGNAQNPRVEAINQLAMEHDDLVRDALLDALTDKDDEVRAAAAEALAKYNGKKTTDALAALFGDGKTSVRLMACAAFIEASRPAAHVRSVKKTK